MTLPTAEETTIIIFEKLGWTLTYVRSGYDELRNVWLVMNDEEWEEFGLAATIYLDRPIHRMADNARFILTSSTQILARLTAAAIKAAKEKE